MNKTTTYEEAKLFASEARLKTDGASKALKVFPKGEMGLTPDSVRNTEEWKLAKKNFNIAFAKEREINIFIRRNFKQELSQENKRRQDYARAALTYIINT